MNRKELVAKLELIKPALAKTNLVPIYTCFTFDDGLIIAYNDQMAILAPIGRVAKQPFAVNGETLLGLLTNTEADNVAFAVEAENVVLTAGKGNYKLPYFEQKEFLFEAPPEDWATELEITDELIEGLTACLTTSSQDNTMPALMGVCFSLEQDAMYSCDGDAITKFSLDFDGKGQYTAPNEFCDALLKIRGIEGNEKGTLGLNNDWAKAVFESGYVLYGRVIEKSPLDHENLIKKTLKDVGDFVEIPVGLNAALSRARVLADAESKKTALIIHKGKLTLETSTHMGQASDELTIQGHRNVEAIVHASLIQRPIGLCDSIMVLDNCTAFKKGDRLLQVFSNVGE